MLMLAWTGHKCRYIVRSIFRHVCKPFVFTLWLLRFEQRGLLDPIKLAYDQRRPYSRLELTASAFNRLGQYADRPGHRTYCYAELAVSSLVMAETIASTHCAYPRRDGQAELTWVAG